MKNIFIIGSRGYHVNYGGWETLTSRLVDNYNDDNVHFYVTQLTHNKNEQGYTRDNVTVVPVYTSSLGGATMFLHSIRAFNKSIKFASDGDIFYILGLKLFNRLKAKKKLLESRNIKVFVNPDGLEWKRSKWSKPVKKFFLKSEKLMLNSADTIICDAIGIKDYVEKKYPKLSTKTKYIAYGFNTYKIDDSLINEFNLKKDNYCLMVGRCVPEDNYELVIKDFMKSKIKKELVVITNFSTSKYYLELKERTNFQNDPRIRFIDGVYDEEKLAAIRKNAYLYIHGHSVGGTNPSLIEAISITDVNVLFDVCFNKDIGQDACLYFKEPGDLTEILDDKIDKTLGKKAKKIAYDNFTWDNIVKQYKELFSEVI